MNAKVKEMLEFLEILRNIELRNYQAGKQSDPIDILDKITLKIEMLSDEAPMQSNEFLEDLDNVISMCDSSPPVVSNVAKQTFIRLKQKYLSTHPVKRIDWFKVDRIISEIQDNNIMGDDLKRQAIIKALKKELEEK